jgi:predicted RNase H-like HicB family nuclease
MAHKITITTVSAVRWDEEAGVHLSWIPSLNIYSQGTTQDEAIQAIQGALTLFAKGCIEKGILDETLTGAGFRKVSAEEPTMRQFTGGVSVKALKELFDQLTPLTSSLAAAV